MAETLLYNHSDILNKLESLILESEEILGQGLEQQQAADELLAEADLANSQAEEAVKLGNKTLQEAQQTYSTLLSK